MKMKLNVKKVLEDEKLSNAWNTEQRMNEAIQQLKIRNFTIVST